MNLTEPVDICVQFPGKNASFHRSSLLKEIKLSYCGIAVDVAQIAALEEWEIQLSNGTRLPRSECEGEIKYMTPGLQGELSFELPVVRSITSAK
jgi:hypothetical protein